MPPLYTVYDKWPFIRQLGITNGKILQIRPWNQLNRPSQLVSHLRITEAVIVIAWSEGSQSFDLPGGLTSVFLLSHALSLLPFSLSLSGSLPLSLPPSFSFSVSSCSSQTSDPTIGNPTAHNTWRTVFV